MKRAPDSVLRALSYRFTFPQPQKQCEIMYTLFYATSFESFVSGPKTSNIYPSVSRRKRLFSLAALNVRSLWHPCPYSETDTGLLLLNASLISFT